MGSNAYASGYYDQMHMIRQFHTFAGMTPTELLKVVEPHHGVAQMSALPEINSVCERRTSDYRLVDAQRAVSPCIRLLSNNH